MMLLLAHLGYQLGLQSTLAQDAGRCKIKLKELVGTAQKLRKVTQKVSFIYCGCFMQKIATYFLQMSVYASFESSDMGRKTIIDTKIACGMRTSDLFYQRLKWFRQRTEKPRMPTMWVKYKNKKKDSNSSLFWNRMLSKRRIYVQHLIFFSFFSDTDCSCWAGRVAQLSITMFCCQHNNNYSIYCYCCCCDWRDSLSGIKT